MPETHARRRAALRSVLRAAELDALLVTNLLNVRYLTGFTGSNAALLVGADDEGADEDGGTLFCTDGRYDTQSAAQVPDLRRLIERPCDLALARAAAGGGVRRVGFESHHVTVDGLTALTEQTRTEQARTEQALTEQALTGLAEGCELVRAPGMVERLRVVKDDAEVEALRMACSAADAALADLLEQGGIAPGRTELEVGRDLESRMRDHGAHGPSFESIVATGANSAVPHHRPTPAVLRQGDLLKLDF
ncbi:MAG TPA: aminopeptidase P family N-terminal domain-containing protein, partial [Pseudonocardiaceae bacterium]|nr:aminopeptidase P family N-terminal domain-containing protein [Pseudonocardiaceae bacterium]